MDARYLLIAILVALFSMPARAEWHGNVTAQLRYFPDAPLISPQEDSFPSLAGELEYTTSLFDDRWQLIFKPFARYDAHDDERTHADVRELLLYTASGDWEWRIGVGKVFWGVTESQHLVDIVNQTDLIEDPDGEDKLGQPMINVTWLQDWGAINFFMLPIFRERTFPGAEGRLRPPVLIDTDNPEFQVSEGEAFAPAQYESDQEDGHVDVAVRYSGTLANYWDVGLYYFNGTSRDPWLIPEQTANGLRLIPRYNQIQQIGLDVQGTFGSWLWKLEAIARDTDPESYEAMVGGFEYTFFDVGGADIGTLLEYHYDTRDQQATSPYQNDVFGGVRLAFNDKQNTQILGGAIVDLDYDTISARLEASRRIGSTLRLDLNAQWFDVDDIRDPLNNLRRDSYIELNLGYFF